MNSGALIETKIEKLVLRVFSEITVYILDSSKTIIWFGEFNFFLTGLGRNSVYSASFSAQTDKPV